MLSQFYPTKIRMPGI